MMCYDANGGSFPFTYEEIELIRQVLSEKISEMESDLDAKDPHRYLKIRSLYGKISGLILLINTKKKGDICYYKGFRTEIKYSPEDACYFGKIEGIRDLVNFEGDTMEDTIKEFYDAVDDYLETVKEVKE